jgi:hypothetical protein
MDSLGIAEVIVDNGNDNEIDRLYDELGTSRCECSRPTALIDSCDFHQKLTRLEFLQTREIEVIKNGVKRLRTSISKSVNLLENMEAGFSDVLK